MKSIKIVLALFVGVIALNLQAQKLKEAPAKSVNTGEYPVITFSKQVHDFGNLNEGDVVETTFEFTNTGNAPLTITRIKASCGCTVPSNWKKAPILPGEKSSFTVKFNSKNKPNRQTKRIRITSNTKDSNEFVTIKANVTPDPELQKQREERMAKWKRERAARRAKASKDGKSVKAGTLEKFENNKSQGKAKVLTDKQKADKAAKEKADLSKKSSLKGSSIK